MSVESSFFCEIHQREVKSLGGRMMCSACLGSSSALATQVWADLQGRTRAAELKSRVRAAGIPASFLAESFDTFRASTDRAATISKRLRIYCESFEQSRLNRPGFIFTGPPGTAKTHLGCSMIHQLLEQGFSAAYMSLPSLTRQIRAAFGRNHVIDDILRKLCAVDLLVLDEIDLHGTSDNDYNMLYDIINSRYEKPGFPTLAISNRPVADLSADLDERVVSRLLAGTSPVVFDWVGQRDVRKAISLVG